MACIKTFLSKAKELGVEVELTTWGQFTKNRRVGVIDLLSDGTVKRGD